MQLLTNARVYGPEPLGVQHLLVAAGRIVWMGPEAPAVGGNIDLQTADLEGCDVVPGLIDCHTHLTGGGGETGYASRIPPLALTELTTAGVTTAIGLLGTDDTVRTTGELLAAARALRALGLTAYCWTGGYHLPPATLTGGVRSDIAHVDLVIGAGEIAISDARSSQPTLDELMRVAGDCHVGGLMTGKAGVMHLHVGDGERGLELVRRALATGEIPPRVYHPTHVNRRPELLDEAFALAREGCTIDVTAYPAGAEGPGVVAADAVERFLEADLPADRLTVSSDGGGCLLAGAEAGSALGMRVGNPSTLAETLRELVDRGRPLEEVLPPFTANPAAHLRLPRKGRVAVDADADLAVLDDDHRITDLMACGRWMIRDRTPLVRGPFEDER